MTAVTLPGRHAPATDRARFSDLFVAEWIKLRSLRPTLWVLLAAAVIATGLSGYSSHSLLTSWPSMTARGRAHFNPLHYPYNSTLWVVLMLIAAGVGALSIAGEYSSGLIRVTFSAVPARLRIVAAKAAVLIAVMIVFGAVISVCAFGLSQAILSQQHIGYSISHPDALRAVVSSALLMPASALVGMGVAALVRNLAGTIFAVCVVIVLLPQLVSSQAILENSWITLSASGEGPIAGLSFGSELGSWILFALWPVVGILVAAFIVRRTDV